MWRLPRDGFDTIEALQPRFRAQPQITIRRLRHRKDGALDEAFANLPRGVRVLAEIECGIQRESARAACQQEGQPDYRRSLRFPHIGTLPREPSFDDSSHTPGDHINKGCHVLPSLLPRRISESGKIFDTYGALRIYFMRSFQTDLRVSCVTSRGRIVEQQSLGNPVWLSGGPKNVSTGFERPTRNC